MHKISCDMCMDLLPLVMDGVASQDSKDAVLEHIATCKTCEGYYTQKENPDMDTKKVLTKIKRQLFFLSAAIMVVGAAFGIAIADGERMFYNIIIMPAIGILSYFVLRKKAFYAPIFVFLCVYLRWLPDTFPYVYEGEFAQAFLPPLFWALIYFGLFSLGMVIAFLLSFGLRKENKNEKAG